MVSQKSNAHEKVCGSWYLNNSRVESRTVTESKYKTVPVNMRLADLLLV